LGRAVSKIGDILLIVVSTSKNLLCFTTANGLGFAEKSFHANKSTNIDALDTDFRGSATKRKEGTTVENKKMIL